MFNIERRKGLKEFMMLHPPWFRISDCCCRDVKMRTVREMIRCESDGNRWTSLDVRIRELAALEERL